MNPDPLANFPTAPAWSLWIGSAGKALVIGGFALFLLSVLLGLLAKRSERLEKAVRVAFTLGCVAVFGSMACLTALFVGNQFHYEYVFGHASIETDLKYKIAGVWTGQQGSFLLWASCSALFGLLAMRGTGEYRRVFTMVFAGFLCALCGILAYESPFNLLKDVTVHGRVLMPPDGNGMVPLLQNYWVVIHPPTIFLGFGSLTVLFAYAVAAIITGYATDWVRRARPWCLVSLAILGLGISMGGLWAYETLGWGGFWMWDPVENASLVPWIFVAGLTHGLIVQSTKGRWVGTNLFLAGLPFLAFLYGTFLTRSGLLVDVSVHSFAKMDNSALQLLKALLIVSFAGFVGLYFVRGRSLAKAAETTLAEEESGLKRAGALPMERPHAEPARLDDRGRYELAVLHGVGGPQRSGDRGGLYHRVVAWFFVPLMLLMAIAPFATWRAMGARALAARVFNVFSVTFGLLGASLFS